MNTPKRPLPRQGQALLVLLALGVLLTGPFLGISMVAEPNDPVDPVDPTQLQWWGPTSIGQGFHLRIPVTVENRAEHPVTNGAVLVEVDIAKRLVEAGWVAERTSMGELLRVFELDPHSIRVVSMNDLEPDDGRFHGRLAFHDGTVGGLQRHVVPSTHFMGTPESGTFHARTGPTVTVLFHVHKELPPGEKAYYVIYFDSLTNQQGHNPPDHSPLRGSGVLESSFWSGPAVELVGLVTRDDPVHIIGLHDNTQVQIRLANSAGRFPATGTLAEFTIDKHEFRRQAISQEEGRAFQILASHPVVALVNSEGYVPTPQGALVGNEFLFSTTYRSDQAIQDSLFFLNRGPTNQATTIRLETLNTNGAPIQGQERIIELDTPENPLPYTLGAHGSAGNPQPGNGECIFPADPGVIQLEPGRAQYRATVIQGGPVALQLQPTRGVTQIPSIDGAPAGTDFWTAFSRTEAQPSACQPTSSLYWLYAASTIDTDLYIHSPEGNPRDEPIFSCTRTTCPGDPLGPIPGTGFRGEGEITTIQRLFDRPLNFRTEDAAWLMVGPEMTGSFSETLFRGPLGGADAGRHFIGIGPTKLYPLYADTRLDATIHYNFGDPFQGRLNLVGNQVTNLPAAPGASIEWYELKSNRPIIVLPERASPGFLAGAPLLLDATLHKADYRGHLVQITTTRGDKDYRELTGPGQSIEYPFMVTNLGRNAHGDRLMDRFQLSALDVPEGWKATIEPPVTRNLGTGESQRVTLTVTPPEDAPAGESATVRIEAVSHEADRLGNDRIRDTARSFTRIETDVDVDLWVLNPNGDRLKFHNGRIEMNGMYNHSIVIENKGTNPDRFELNLLDSVEPGWSAFLLHGGREIADIQLQPSQTAQLTFQVIPPRDQEAIWMPMSIEARSTTDTSVTDVVTAYTDVVAPSDLFLDTPEPIQWIQPGAEALFQVTLGNDGAGAARVFLDVQADDLRDWTAPTIFTEEPSTDGASLVRHQITEENVHPQSHLTRWINITAPSDAVAGDRIVIHLQVQAEGQAHALNGFFIAIVEPLHRLKVDTPPLPLHTIRGGVPLEVDLWITNDGNMDEVLRPMITELPPGWRLGFHQDLLLIPLNGTQDPDATRVRLGLEIEPPEGVSDGDYLVAFDLVSREGNRTVVDVPVSVGAFLDHDIRGPDLIQGQPGRTAWAEYRVWNRGNIPLTLELERLNQDEEPWDLTQVGTTRHISPGADTVLPVGWQVPRDASDGTDTHRAVLVLRPDHPDVESVRYPLEVDIEIARADLFVAEATSLSSPGGYLVRAVVGNQGDRSAHNVLVELRVGTTVVDQVGIGEVAPGSTRNLTLLQPSGFHGVTTIFVNSDETTVESDRTNNMLTIATEENHKESSGPNLVLVMAIFGILRWVTSRKSRR